MKKLFFSGSEINKQWGVPPAQILSGIRAGKLLPFDSSGSKRILDKRNPAPIFEDITNTKYVNLNNDNVLDYIFNTDKVKTFLADLDIYDSENPPEEVRRWISGWGISQRWALDKRSLANKVLSGELNAYDPHTLEEADVQKEREKLGDDPGLLQGYAKAITARGFDLLFRWVDIDAWEARGKPVSPNIEPGQPASSQILPPAQQDNTLQESETQRQPVQQERVTPEQKKASNFFTRGGRQTLESWV